MRAAAAVGLVAAALVLAACTGAGPAPAGVNTSPSPAASTADAATAPATPVLVPGGTAAQNLPLFAEVTASVWATPSQAAGRAYVDALAAAGFDKARMQVTSDTTTLGTPAESIQFSVAWTDGQCLVGQVGPATGQPVTAVLPALGGGACLVGATRPIDW